MAPRTSRIIYRRILPEMMHATLGPTSYKYLAVVSQASQPCRKDLAIRTRPYFLLKACRCHGPIKQATIVSLHTSRVAHSLPPLHRHHV